MLLMGTGVKDVLSAQWGQFDLARGTWTKPGMVLGKPISKRVQLSEATLALLEAMQVRSSQDSDHLFTNAFAGASSNVEASWKRATTTAGIDDADLYALRPVFAKRLFEGLSESVTHRLLGLADPIGQTRADSVSGS